MKFRITCLLAVLALALATTGAAQTDASQYSGPTTTVSGTVVSSSATSLVIKSDSGTQQTFMIDSASRVPSGLAAGSRVTVNYHTLDGGEFHAATVTLAEAPSASRVPPAEPREADDRPLPATASDEPLLLVGGLVALGMGLALRRATRSLSHS